MFLCVLVELFCHLDLERLAKGKARTNCGKVRTHKQLVFFYYLISSENPSSSIVLCKVGNVEHEQLLKRTWMWDWE